MTDVLGIAATLLVVLGVSIIAGSMIGKAWFTRRGRRSGVLPDPSTVAQSEAKEVRRRTEQVITLQRDIAVRVDNIVDRYTAERGMHDRRRR